MWHRKNTTRWSFSTVYTLCFVAALSAICALILASLSLFLSDAKERARRLDKSEQLLMSARIYSPDGTFLIRQGSQWVPASVRTDGELAPSSKFKRALPKEILEVYQRRVLSLFVDTSGRLVSPSSKSPNQKLLPIYQILSNDGKDVDCYVVPVHGFGLWDRIFGFIAIEPDGMTVRGVTWYDQKETPGLGGVIADPAWQTQFQGKSIFQQDQEGRLSRARAPLGVKVVKGMVQDVYGTSPMAKSAVDGISGATLTGSGVTNAYASCLSPYRKFFENLEQQKKS